MPRHIISKKDKYKFYVFWVKNNSVSLENSAINLDFSPFIDKILLNYPKVNFYCLLHWQAMPKGLRRWGLYDSISEQYYSADEVENINEGRFITLQLNENIIKTVPVAVLFFPNTKLLQTNVLYNTDTEELIKVSIGG